MDEVSCNSNGCTPTGFRICLINPPGIISVDNPHLGIAYIAAMLRTHGYAVDIFDCPVQNLCYTEIYDVIKRGMYHIVGISCYDYNYKEVFILGRFLEILKPKPFVVLGGYLPTLSPEMALEISGVACVVIGEGEFTMLDLVERIMSGNEWRNTPGIAYFCGEKIIYNQYRRVDNLDKYPFPVRDFAIEGDVSIIASRGCFGTCSFCSINAYYSKVGGPRLRFRSPENVTLEMKDITDRMGIKRFTFIDDDFFAVKHQPDWLERFANQIKINKLKCSFILEGRIGQIEESDLKLLKPVGLKAIYVGLESIVPRQQRLYKKIVRKQAFLKKMVAFRKYDIRMIIGLMLIDPFVVLSEIKTNIKFLLDSNYFDIAYPMHPLCSDLQFVFVHGNTPLYELLKGKGLLNATAPYGFEIQDRAVMQYIQVVALWRSTVIHKLMKMFEIFKYFDESSFPVQYKQLASIYSKFMEQDAGFLLELIDAIGAESIRTLEHANKFVLLQSTRVKVIETAFIEAIRYLKSNGITPKISSVHTANLFNGFS